MRLGQLVLFETRASNSSAQVLQSNLNGDLYDKSGRFLRVDRTGRVYETESGRTRGYLQPIPFQAVRRHVAAIFNHQTLPGPMPSARLDDQLIAIRRTEQERARKTLQTPLVRQELAALKYAPVIINWS